jgi:hypothetical protein
MFLFVKINIKRDIKNGASCWILFCVVASKFEVKFGFENKNR